MMKYKIMISIAFLLCSACTQKESVKEESSYIEKYEKLLNNRVAVLNEVGIDISQDTIKKVVENEKLYPSNIEVDNKETYWVTLLLLETEASGGYKENSDINTYPYEDPKSHQIFSFDAEMLVSPQQDYMYIFKGLNALASKPMFTNTRILGALSENPETKITIETKMNQEEVVLYDQMEYDWIGMYFFK